MVKKITLNAINCPVCNNKITIGNKKEEIIVCETCENSLFMYNVGESPVIHPIALNISIKGDKILPEEDYSPEEVEDEEDEFDFD